MQRTIRRMFGYVCLAIVGCLGMIGYANAAESLTKYHLSALALDSGDYGAESAKLKVELAHMQSIKEDRTSLHSGLTSIANGFVQTFLTKSGVAGGMTGVGAGAQMLG